MTLPPIVVFDLDGTLVDTADDLAAAMNHCLALEGLPALPAASVRPLIGNGARALIKRGLESARPCSDADVERLVPAFMSHYRAHIADQSKAYEGVLETLETLLAMDCALGICTNKPEGLSLILLEKLKLAKYFPVVLGSDSLPVRKPDPGHLLATIDRLGGSPDQAVMVGDSHVDIETARRARVPVVAVTFGYASQPVQDCAPTIVIDHYREMLDALRASHGPLRAMRLAAEK